jgi:hypothetical protein
MENTMSRYQIAAIDPKFEVTVGWDAPMTTFFAQVVDRALDEADDDNALVLWIGDRDMAVPTIDQLIVAIARYATIPADVIEQLQADYDTPWTPSTIQQMNRKMMADIQKYSHE